MNTNILETLRAMSEPHTEKDETLLSGQLARIGPIYPLPDVRHLPGRLREGRSHGEEICNRR